MRRLSRFVAIVLAGGAGLGLCFAALIPASATLLNSSRFSSKIADHLSTLAQRTVVYDADGNQIGIFAADDRERVKLSNVPKNLVNAVIATEDRTFWKNPGVDLQSTFRALWANVTSGKVEQGGSTITQQLIKNRILTPKRDLNRKLREAILAYRFNDEFSKKQILEEYLNTVYFGQGSYGVKTAAERFFAGEKLDQLTLGQASLLAGLIQNPEGYNPFFHPDAARARRLVVLQRMLDQHDITKAQAFVAALEPLLPDPAHPPSADYRPANYFLAEVEQRLFDDKRLGRTASDRENAVLRGGLRVYTTYDPRLQFLAQASVTSTLQQATPRGPDITAAMVVMDPQTGAVRAVVGGPGFQQNQFDIATHYRTDANSGRQPGSTFKVVTLATALENGYSPFDSVSGVSPCVVKFPGYAPTPPLKNAEQGPANESIRTATVDSVNCAYLRIGASLGLDKVTEMAQRLGICAGATTTAKTCPYWQLDKTDNRPDANGNTAQVKVPTMVYGSAGGQTPLDMATIFNTLAADGVRHDPIFYTKVVGPDGKTLFQNKTTGNRVLDPQVARTTTDILRGVITNGTGTNARLDGGRVAAGKTGTTDSETDAWFDGYTPQLTAVVWMGNLASETPMGKVGRYGTVFGGTWPAIIWKTFMNAALEGQPNVDFLAPDKSLWPSGRRITDAGRGTAAAQSDGGAGVPAPTSAPPQPATTSSSVVTTTSSTKPTTSSSTPSSTVTTGAVHR
ncbi:MAG TPA: transglycosylase domain-containing protein [Acidimicrobiia bacterium]|nr:transglycosylase domain-containing protein [Acidimicrobiia bacterium]